MAIFDWCLLWIPITAVMIVALYTARFNKSVVDFIAAGRCAGRYLIATARGEAGSAAVTAIALFQMTLKTGFAFQFWAPLYSSIPILLAVIGWVTYRFRETRVLTAGQYFEVRYSRSFRLFMGFVGFLSGILNYGVFPAISSRFFVYFLQLPETVTVGGLACATWSLIALAYLSVSLFFVLLGGQISILVSDCLEGLFSQIGYVVIIIALLLIFGWSHIVETLKAQPSGHSMINPFDMGKTEDFNIYFILISLFHSVWGAGIGGMGVAAKSPHELRMAGLLGSWRGYGFALMRTILAICAIVFLTNPHFTATAQSVAAHAQLNSIGETALQSQMKVPIAASHFLPWGVKGLFCAIMLMGVMTGDAGALHDRGNGFVQDVILPIRGFFKMETMSPGKHILFLRIAAVSVAAFGFLFSCFFNHTQAIQLYWQVTGAIYAGGAGAVTVFGLYWKRGTQAAAWVTMIVGATVALTGLGLQHAGYTFFIGSQDMLHGQYVSLITTITAITTYVSISLLTCRAPFNMDKMLHRGQYAVAGEAKKVAPTLWERFKPSKIIGIDEEYTFWDRVVALGIFGWIWTTLAISMICLVWNLIYPWSNDHWVTYWFIFGLCVPFTLSVFTTIWFTIGGVREIGIFFRSLAHEKRDQSDDGSVGPGHPV